MSDRTTTLRVRIQSMCKTEADWIEQDPVLLDNEVGYTLETGQYKIGQNGKHWSELDYKITEIGTISTEQVDALFE